MACLTAALILPGPAAAGDAYDVAALQVALRIHGAHTGAIDGIFGPETKAAVRRFQRSRGLAADGVPRQPTLSALGSFARHRLGGRVIRPDASGWDVAALQYLLVQCGLSPGAIDGVFGYRTRSAVVSYQRRAALYADGLAGGVTIARLRAATACRKASGTVPVGVTVSGISIGGLAGRWAEMALRSAFARPLRLRANDQAWLAEPDAFARPDTFRAVRRALRAPSGAALRLRVAVQLSRVRRYAAGIEERVCRPAVDARLVGLRSLRPVISRGRPGCRVLRASLEREIARRLAGFERSPIDIPIHRIPPAVTRARFGPVVVVTRRSHRLYLYRAAKLVRVLSIGTGQRSSPTPTGRFEIVATVRRPWWYPPDSKWAEGQKPIPPGPGNPLGTRWMGISSPGVGIHGTPDAASIGYSRSHGCIRMYPRDAEWLFRRVRVGTPVIIVPV